MRQSNIVTEYEFREFAKKSESVLRLAEDFIKETPDIVDAFKIRDAEDCISKILRDTVVSAVYEDGTWEFELGVDVYSLGGIKWGFTLKVADEFMKTEGVEYITVIRD